MRAPAILVAGTALLAACGKEQPPIDDPERAEREIAMVNAANAALPPRRDVTPEPIGAPEMDEHDMHGAACNYAPGTSLGTRVIARPDDAFMKLDGEVLRFAADPGTRELPANTRTHYVGREFSLRLTVEGEGRERSGGAGPINYEGTIRLFDRWGREIYWGTGLVQCSA